MLRVGAENCSNGPCHYSPSMSMGFAAAVQDSSHVTVRCLGTDQVAIIIEALGFHGGEDERRVVLALDCTAKKRGSPQMALARW